MGEEQKAKITFKKRKPYLLLLAESILWSLWLSRMSGYLLIALLAVTLSVWSGEGGPVVWAIIVPGGMWLVEKRFKTKPTGGNLWALRVMTCFLFSAIYAVVTVLFEEATGISLAL